MRSSGLFRKEPTWEESRNSGDNGRSIVDISVCVMKPPHKHIAELKSPLEEKAQFLQFQKTNKWVEEKKHGRRIFGRVIIKAFKEAMKQTLRHADQRESEDTEHLQTLHVCLFHRRRNAGTSGRAAADVATAVPVSAWAASKTLYRFTGNSGRNLLMDSQTAVARGGAGRGSEGMDGVQCWTASKPRTSGEPLEVHCRILENLIEIE